MTYAALKTLRRGIRRFVRLLDRLEQRIAR
jgi:hypothetical protein